jgi:two-component system invasion response regulator UvrY
MSKSIRVLLVDDHAIVREGYHRLIEKHHGIEVVAEAGSAAAGYEAFKRTTPDVAVVDISMPGRGGIDLVRQIRQWDAAARVLVFSMHASATYAQQAFRAGARGYVTKSSPPEILVSAIRDVFVGKPALCAEINQAIATSRLCDEVSAVDELSPREFEILSMILDAKSTDEIARAFNLSPKTVANYHYEIKSKLGVRSDIEMVYLCMRQGLVASLVEPGAA